MRFRDFTVVVNASKDPGMETAKEVCRYLGGMGVSCGIAPAEPGTDASRIADGTDCVLVLGGDGTVLRAVRDLDGRRIPVLGINLGRLGYLAEIEAGEWRSALDRILADDFTIEPRMMLEGCGADGVMCYALNDAVITRNGIMRVVSYDILVNGRFLNTYVADGMIISTPTGSTAYNLSAGGPIVEPSARMIVITPICPHTLNTRSIVLSADETITVRIGEGQRDYDQASVAVFDGGSGPVLHPGEEMVIRRSERCADLVRLSRGSFLETLHRKISV